MNKMFMMLIVALITMYVNASEQSQFEKANTYYEIKEDIDLGGRSVTIPHGCMLKFAGGQIKNGTLIGNETWIDASPYSVFANSLSLEGTFLATEAYPEWFEDNDDGIKIRKAVNNFDNVKLTARHYVMQTVDEKGFGVALPEGHILRGNRRADNSKADDQVLKIKDGVSYKAVVALNASTVLSDLTIHGSSGSGTSAVATTNGFQSRLTIERVGVSGSYYGFNLQTYLTNICQCVASYTDVGFYIHGSMKGNSVKTEGTSVNMTTCFAVDSKKVGYDIVGLTYSAFNNCAADGCGAPTSGTLANNTEIGYAYSFTQSKNLSLNSCGMENGLAAVITSNCRNIVFNAPSLLINKRQNVQVSKDYKMKPILNIRYSVCIEFNYMFMYTKGMDKYYDSTTPLMLLYGSATELPSVIINKAYDGIAESNIGTEGFLSKVKHLIIK